MYCPDLLEALRRGAHNFQPRHEEHLQQQEKSPVREIKKKKIERITGQPGVVSVLGAEARAAGAGGRCKPPKRPETAFQTVGEPRRPADLGNMSIRPAVRCGRRAAVRLLGARDGGRGAAAAAAAAAVSAESREKEI